MGRRALLGLTAVALTLAVPASAHAGNGVVTRSAGTITVDYRGTPDDDAFHVFTTATTIQLSDNGGSSTMTDNDPDPGDCSQFSPTRVDCPLLGTTRLVVFLGAGEDYAEIQTFSPSVALELDAGPGDDPEILGSSGDDIIDGGPGDDSLFSGGGDDVVRGGAGNDEMAGGAETDELYGGDGFDFVDFAGATPSVTVTLDDLPGDGPAGDLDNIHSDVEDIYATSARDVIVGSALSNVIHTGGGDDEIDGGGGVDRIRAGDGADMIRSRDGVAEIVECGNGADTAIVDDIDVTDGCETEQRSSIFQTDVDGDGSARPLDCNDTDPAIRPGAPDALDDGIDQDCNGADATNLDRDGDGVPRPIDCDDGDARSAPGKRERRGNRRDEDCNGRAEPFILVENAVPNLWSVGGSVTRNLALGVRDVREGMRIELRCRGGGCPFGRKLRKVTRRARLLNLHPILAGATLRAGARLELRILRPEAIGKVVRYTIRSGAAPASRVLCLPPGKKRPRTC